MKRIADRGAALRPSVESGHHLVTAKQCALCAACGEQGPLLPLTLSKAIKKDVSGSPPLRIGRHSEFISFSFSQATLCPTSELHSSRIRHTSPSVCGTRWATQ